MRLQILKFSFTLWPLWLLTRKINKSSMSKKFQCLSTTQTAWTIGIMLFSVSHRKSFGNGLFFNSTKPFCLVIPNSFVNKMAEWETNFCLKWVHTCIRPENCLFKYLKCMVPIIIAGGWKHLNSPGFSLVCCTYISSSDFILSHLESSAHVISDFSLYYM